MYAKVAKLFKNQEDLLIEFSQFLPDANNSGTNLGINSNFSSYINPLQTQQHQQQQQQQQQQPIMISDLSVTNNPYMQASNGSQSTIGMPLISNANLITTYNLSSSDKMTSSGNFSSTTLTPLIATSNSAPIYTLGSALNQIKASDVSANSSTPRQPVVVTTKPTVSSEAAVKTSEKCVDKSHSENHQPMPKSLPDLQSQSRPLTPINQAWVTRKYSHNLNIRINYKD